MNGNNVMEGDANNRSKCVYRGVSLWLWVRPAQVVAAAI